MRLLPAIPLLLLFVGCTDAAPFHCDSNAACDNNGEQGTCEPTGYCSFADTTCPSGRRYGEYAGNGLGDACVEAGGDCGSENGPCCATGSACGAGLVCDSQQTCERCGGLAQPCCEGRTCAGSLTCEPLVDLCA